MAKASAAQPMSGVPVDPVGPADVWVRFQGAPAWRVGQRAVWRALGRQDALLLLWLASEGPLPRAHVAMHLWPDKPAARAGSNLRQRIHVLRQAAGSDLVVDDGTGSIGLAPLQHDLDDFHLVLQPDQDGLPRAGLLEGVAFDADDALDAWLTERRERWRHQRSDCWAAHADALVAAGRLDAAVEYAAAAIEDMPLDEAKHRRVMRIHGLRGDRAAALAAFQRCERMLDDELGVAPDAQTQALAARLRAAEPSPALPVALRRPAPLVGRADALARLAAAHRAGRHLLVCGEPGIGKTRLLSEWALSVAAVSAAALPGDAILPYATAARLVRAWLTRCGAPVADAAWACAEWARFVPELGAAPPWPAQGVRLQQAMTAWATHAAQAGPGAVVVDDLQFADPASLDLVLSLCGPGRAVRVVAAVRSGEIPQALSAALAGPLADAVEVLHLASWTEGDIAALLQALDFDASVVAPWAAALRRHAGGNPFFTLQTLAAVEDLDRSVAPPGLPLVEHLAQMLRQRLARCSPAAQQLARLAALAGDDFSLALAVQLTGQGALALAPAWAELESAQVLQGERFAHDLMREATRHEIPATIATAVHRQIADALATQGVPEARLAHHLERALDWAAAAAAHQAAARAALAVGRYREQAAALGAAAQAWVRSGRRDAALRVRCEMLGALVQCDTGADLQDTLSALHQEAQALGQAWRADIAAAEVNNLFGDYARTLATLPPAMAAADAAGDMEAACVGARRRAVALAQTGRAAEETRSLLACAADVDAHLDTQARGEFHAELGTLLGDTGQRELGAHHLRTGIALAESSGDLACVATALVNLGINRQQYGDQDGAIEATQRGAALHERFDAPGGLGHGIDMSLGGMLRDTGDYAGALVRLERAAAAFDDEGNALWAVNARNHLALLWCHLGQWERAKQLLDAPVPDTLPFLMARRLALRAAIGEALGQADPGWLAQARELAAAGGRADIRLAIELQWASTLSPSDGAAACRAVATEAQRQELLGLAVAARAAGLAAVACSGTALPRPLAEDAVDLIEDAERLSPAGYFRPQLWWFAAQALQASGDAAAAHRAVQAGWRWIRARLDQVPAPFRDRFLRRNAVVHALNQRMRERGAAP